MYTQNSVERIKINASSVFTSRVGLGYSRFMLGRNEIGVSFDTFMRLAKVPDYDSLPLKTLKGKVSPDTNTEELGNDLRSEMSRSNPLDSVW